jgi:hypothetical protein
MDFGLGAHNITATDYLSKSVLPCLDHCLSRLIDHVIQTGEIDKWKALKEEEYTKARREAKRKQRKEAGESVSGSDEWEDSENSEEKEEVQAPFDPVSFLSEQILQYRQNN